MGDRAMEERPKWVVAVTGHRHIDPVLIPGLRLRVSGALDGLCLRVGGAPRPLMRNALAAGADSLAFDIAAEKAIPVDDVLPLLPEKYKKDFAPGADRDGLRRRMGKARRVWSVWRRSRIGATRASSRSGSGWRWKWPSA